jgi:peptide/nickel transport system substrate-binding protein
MTDAVPSDHYTMKKRDGYRWDPNGNRSDAAGFPDTVTIKIIQNASTAANLLLSGGLNAAGANGPDRPRLEAAHLTKVASPVLLFELFYNEAPGHPGSDENVRRALTMALDLGQVGKVADGGLGQPATGLAVTPPRACPGDTVKGNLPRHDVNEAAALLDKAGWKKGAGGVREKDGKPMTMTLLQPSAEGDQVAAAVELVSQSWKKLGVDVSIKAATDTGLIDIIDKTGAWDAGQIPVNHYLPSVIQAFVSGPAPPQGNNVAHISNKGYDRLSAQALKTPGEAGCKLWNDAEKELFKHVDVVPVVNDLQPVYGQKATFSPGPYGFDPTSVRLLG